jgi:cytochrome P450
MLGTDFSLYQILAGAVGLYVLYAVIQKITIGAARRKFMKEHGCEPPPAMPSGDPFLNLRLHRENVKLFKTKQFLPTVRERFLKHGNTYSLMVMGKNAVTTCEPENIKAVLATNFNDFNLGDRRKAAFTPILGHGIFSTDGAAWERSRGMLRPNFVRSQVGDLPTFETHVSHLIDAIPRDGSTVDLQDLFFRLTIDSATEFLFGSSTLCLAPGTEMHSANGFAEAFNYCTEAMGRHSRMGWISNFIPEPEYKKNKKVVHDFADGYVNAALEYRRTHDVEKQQAPGGRYIFLHELVKQTTDPYQIRSELLNILLAGRDTTASLLSNLWFELAKRPDIWAKLREEVDALGGEKPTYQQLKDMKYLKYCLNESLRLNPVVPGNSRTAIRDTVIPVGGGPDGKSPVFIPKDTLILYSPYTMHRRQDYYGADTMEFKPERWEKLRPGWEYLPFNGGPRICIGQQFALTEASYTTVRMMQEFKGLESRDPRAWEEWLTLTCASGNGTKVALTPF